MNELLERIAHCVECGKISKTSPFPAELKGQDGADELTRQALDQGVPPQEILNAGMIVGMQRIGAKFRANMVFVPDLMMAAKAMATAMKHIKPFFESGQVKRKGTLVIGTVTGDLHDIGKNLVGMIVGGGGWEVVDLGVDVTTEKFLKAVQDRPGCVVGLSALLTTTMANMEKTVIALKAASPEITILVGGAPLTQEFATRIGAAFYSPDPQKALDFLSQRFGGAQP